MSTYSILNAPVPTISYSILHQPGSSASADEYVETIRELHAAVMRESDALTAAYQKSVRETITRESQALRGALGEFLAMPVRSDTASVQKIFGESLERYQQQIVGTAPLGVLRSYEGRILDPGFQKPAERKLLVRGRSYLKGLGFATGKTSADVFESVFLVQGGMNLDLLEHIIRDRVGIYGPTHGRHLEQAGRYLFAAYNLVGSWGTVTRADILAGHVEAALHFSKPAMAYDAFRGGLVAALEVLVKEKPIRQVSLWQRKLGLGRGSEFILRCTAASPGDIGDVLGWLGRCHEPAFLKSALMSRGQLVVKELVHP